MSDKKMMTENHNEEAVGQDSRGGKQTESGDNSSSEMFTATLHEHDVLLGRGQGPRNHPGNRHLRSLVRDNEFVYANVSKRKEKDEIARRIVSLIQNRNPPGRFMAKVKDKKLYRIQNDEEAIVEKMKQTFRDLNKGTAGSSYKQSPERNPEMSPNMKGEIMNIPDPFSEYHPDGSQSTSNSTDNHTPEDVVIGEGSMTESMMPDIHSVTATITTNNPSPCFIPDMKMSPIAAGNYGTMHTEDSFNSDSTSVIHYSDPFNYSTHQLVAPTTANVRGAQSLRTCPGSHALVSQVDDGSRNYNEQVTNTTMTADSENLKQDSITSDEFRRFLTSFTFFKSSSSADILEDEVPTPVQNDGNMTLNQERHHEIYNLAESWFVNDTAISDDNSMQSSRVQQPFQLDGTSGKNNEESSTSKKLSKSI